MSPYLSGGTRHIYWLPSVADTAAPTQAELDAGIDLSAYIDIDEVIEHDLDDSPDAFRSHPDDLNEYNDPEASRE
jgi:hypothetical protein